MTLRRFLPGIAVFLLLVNVGGLLGGGLGLRFWPVFLGLALAGLVTLGVLALDRRRRDLTGPRRPRGPRRRANDEAYDLEADTSTDEQRWLM